MKCQFYLPGKDKMELRECGDRAIWERRTSDPNISPVRHYCQEHKERLMRMGIGKDYQWKMIAE